MRRGESRKRLGTELNRRRQPFQIFQQLNFAEWPQFCDHSVTSADVRLSVGLEGKHLVFETVLRTACFDRDAL